jgi:hypothetical protein
MGVHAKAGADVVDILQDVSMILTCSPQRSRFVAVGGWDLNAGVSVMHLSPPTEAHRFAHPSGAIKIDNWLAMNAFLQCISASTSTGASILLDGASWAMPPGRRSLDVVKLC